MLSSVLRSKRAVQMNIQIVRAFIRMREMLSEHKDLAVRVERVENVTHRRGAMIRVPSRRDSACEEIARAQAAIWVSYRERRLVVQDGEQLGLAGST